MIVTKIHSGLGNQMFQYATAKSLSVKNKASLWLDISSFVIDKRWLYGLDAFNFQCKLTDNFQVPLVNNLASKIGIQKLQFHYYNDSVWIFDQKLHADNGKYIYLSGYWGWPLYFKNIDAVLRKDFQLKTPLEFTCKKWVTLTQQNNSVSIHVRRSDYVADKDASQFFGALGIGYYHKAINYIKSHVTTPHFFLFSDDLNWVRENFIPELGIENYSLVQDDCLSLPAQELTLMSYCQHNIIANSTFSWWGAWLNNNPNKIVIQPDIWYRDKAAQEIYSEGHTNIKGCVKL